MRRQTRVSRVIVRWMALLAHKAAELAPMITLIGARPAIIR